MTWLSYETFDILRLRLLGPAKLQIKSSMRAVLSSYGGLGPTSNNSI